MPAKHYLVSPQGGGSSPPPPPPSGAIVGTLVGLYQIGSQSYTTTWMQDNELCHATVLGFNLGGGSSAPGGSIAAALTTMKANNNLGLQVGFYSDIDSWPTGNTGPPAFFAGGRSDLYTLVNNFPNWWAWSNAQTLSGHVTTDGGDFYLTNQTQGYSGLLNGGLYWPQAANLASYNGFVAGTGGFLSTDVPGSLLDAIYQDNLGPYAQEAYDYNASGSTSSPTSTGFEASWQLGNANGAKEVSSRGKMAWCNAATWGIDGNTAGGTFQSVWNGGVFESAGGESYSAIQYGGWSTFLAQILQIYNTMISGSRTILGVNNVTSAGIDPYTTTGGASVRFWQGVAQMFGMPVYFAANTAYNTNAALWFDYQSWNSSGVCQLRSSFSSYQAGRKEWGQNTTALGGVTGSGLTYTTLSGGGLQQLGWNTVDNTGWIWLIRPPGVAAFTVNASSIPGCTGFKLLTGTQFPTIDTGATVSSLTVPANSGDNYDGVVAQCL